MCYLYHVCHVCHRRARGNHAMGGRTRLWTSFVFPQSGVHTVGPSCTGCMHKCTTLHEGGGGVCIGFYAWGEDCRRPGQAGGDLAEHDAMCGVTRGRGEPPSRCRVGSSQGRGWSGWGHMVGGWDAGGAFQCSGKNGPAFEDAKQLRLGLFGASSVVSHLSAEDARRLTQRLLQHGALLRHGSGNGVGGGTVLAHLPECDLAHHLA